MNETIIAKLSKILSLSPLIIGVGNELRGDDAAGVEIIQRLKRLGYNNTLTVYSTPENYLQKISSTPGNIRLWIDIINWNAPAGDVRIFTIDEIGQYTISTHNFSPLVLVQYLQRLKNIPDYFLGIQPLDLTLGNKISPPVQKTIDKLIDFIYHHLRQNN